MTKDNWIKALDTILKIHFVGRPTDFRKAETMIENFISQVEKDAIEKTNKRWRERIINYFAGAGELWFDYIGLTEEEQKQAAIDELSDLLEDKK